MIARMLVAACGAVLVFIAMAGGAVAQQTAAQVVASREIPVDSECTVVGRNLFVFVDVHITWKESADPERQGIVPAPYSRGEKNDLWYVNCDLESNHCDGFTFNLTRARSGALLRGSDTHAMIGARLIAKSYPRFVVEWGSNLLVVDLEEKGVQLTTEGVLDQRGNGSCRASYVSQTAIDRLRRKRPARSRAD